MKQFRGRSLSLILFLTIFTVEWQATATEVLSVDWQTGEAAVSVNNLQSPDTVGDQIREILRDALYILADTLVWGVPDILLEMPRLFKFITALDSQQTAHDISKRFRGSSKVNVAFPVIMADVANPALIQRRATHFREPRNVEDSDDIAGVPRHAWLISFNIVALAVWLGSAYCILSASKDPQAFEEFRQEEDTARDAAMKRLMMNHMNEEDSARKHFMMSQQSEVDAATRDPSTPKHHILVGSSASRSPSFLPGRFAPPLMSSGGLPPGQV